MQTSWRAHMHCSNAYVTSQWQCRPGWCALHGQLPATSLGTTTAAGLNQELLLLVAAGSRAKHGATIQRT